MSRRRVRPRFLVLFAAVAVGVVGVVPLSAGAASAAIAPATASSVPAGPAVADEVCAVKYGLVPIPNSANSLDGAGGTGGTMFGASIMLTNGVTPVDGGWMLSFGFPDPQQRVQRGWGGEWTQHSGPVNVRNLPENASLAAGAPVRLGFVGTYFGTNPVPKGFSLNGRPCNVTPTGGSHPANVAPVVALSAPREYSWSGRTDPAALAVDPDGTVDRVEFFAGPVLLGVDTTAPYTAHWSLPDIEADFGAGYGAVNGLTRVTAVAHDNRGAATVSAPVRTVDGIYDPVLIETTPTLVVVPEGGSVPVTVSIYSPVGATPSVPFTVTRVSGDADLAVSISSPLLPWTNRPVTLYVTAAPDADSVNGTAAFTVSGAGWTSATFLAVEQESRSPVE